MFATLLGGLPRPDLDAGADVRAEVEAVIRAQEAAGLEPLTDGRRSDPSAPAVERWQYAASLTDRPVKQALLGPYSAARRAGGGVGEAGGPVDEAVVVARVRAEIEALAEAGCPLIEIEEPEAPSIGADDAARGRFRELHALLLEGLDGVHLSLSITGGAADRAGPETILAAPYASFAFDLIAGSDNWRLVTAVPGDRGVIAGALGARERGDESKEVLLWAAHYAASTAGRGLVRVGLGSAGGYEHLPWPVVERKLRRLGEAARLAAMPPGKDLSRRLDPRAVSIRTAALGHDAPPAPKRRRRPGGSEA